MLSFKAHKKPLMALAFSPDGRFLATGASQEEAWKLHDLSKTPPEVVLVGREPARPAGTTLALFGCTSLVFSRDGRWLAGIGAGCVWLVDVRDPFDIRSIILDEGQHVRSISSLVFVGSTLFGVGAVLMRWPLTDHLVPVAFEECPWEGTFTPPGRATFPLGVVAVSRDESVMAVAVAELGADRYHSTFRLFEPRTGRVLGKLMRGPTFPGDHPKAASFSPDGRTLASCHSGTVAVFDVAAQQEVKAFSTGKKHLNALGFSADGARLLTVSNDKSARQWETKSWSEVRTVEWDIGRLTSLATSVDGCLFAAGSHLGRVVIWDAV